jgi:hypothetical protein
VACALLVIAHTTCAFTRSITQRSKKLALFIANCSSPVRDKVQEEGIGDAAARRRA